MESMVDNGEDWMQALLDFRNELATHHDPSVKRKLRQFKRRTGHVQYQKTNGKLIPGPYKPDVRRELLRKLLETQEEVRRTGPDPEVELISEAELREIRKIWQQELQDWEDSVPRIFEEVTGRELDCVHDDVTNFNIQDKGLLNAIATEHGVHGSLVGRLLDLEREKHGMSRRAGIFEGIKSILREDWRTEEEILTEETQRQEEAAK